MHDGLFDNEQVCWCEQRETIRKHLYSTSKFASWYSTCGKNETAFLSMSSLSLGHINVFIVFGSYRCLHRLWFLSMSPLSLVLIDVSIVFGSHRCLHPLRFLPMSSLSFVLTNVFIALVISITLKQYERRMFGLFCCQKVGVQFKDSCSPPVLLLLPVDPS